MNNHDGEVSENTEYLAGLFMEMLEQLDKALEWVEKKRKAAK